jgi:hypothetical protein
MLAERTSAYREEKNYVAELNSVSFLVNGTGLILVVRASVVLIPLLLLSVISQLPKPIREGAITVRKIRSFPILMMTLVL